MPRCRERDCLPAADKGSTLALMIRRLRKVTWAKPDALTHELKAEGCQVQLDLTPQVLSLAMPFEGWHGSHLTAAPTGIRLCLGFHAGNPWEAI
jgi:hypothetical protein